MASKTSEQPRGKLNPTPSALLVSQLPEGPRRLWGKQARKSDVVVGKDISQINWCLALQLPRERAQRGPTGADSSFGPQGEGEVKDD